MGRVASVAAAAIGAYYLLRRLGISRFAATCGGLIYCTNGFMIFWTNWPQSNIAALLPALFVTADILRERRRARDRALFAAVVAAMFLEGYPPLFLASLYALAPFLVVRWWESSTPDPDHRPRVSIPSRVSYPPRLAVREAVTPAALVIGGLVLGAAVAAFQLIPFLARVGVYDTSYRNADARVGIQAATLLTTIFPQAFGDPAQVGRDAIGSLVPVGHLFFVGAATVVFALWAVVQGRPHEVGRVTYRYWLIGAIVLLLTLIGNPQDAWAIVNRPMTTVLYALPGMDQVPLSRLVALFLFFVTLLAAFGIEHVVASTESLTVRPTRWWRTRIAVVVGCVAGFTALALDSEAQLLSRTITVGGRVIRGITPNLAPQAVVFGDRSWILRHSIVPALIVIAAVLVIFVAGRWRGRARLVAIAAIPVMLAIEALLVTTSGTPRAPTCRLLSSDTCAAVSCSAPRNGEVCRSWADVVSEYEYVLSVAVCDGSFVFAVVVA